MKADPEMRCFEVFLRGKFLFTWYTKADDEELERVVGRMNKRYTPDDKEWVNYKFKKRTTNVQEQN